MHPDHTAAYSSLIKSKGEGTSKAKHDEAIEHLREEGGVAWLNTNSLLFCHALEYQNNMIELITRSQEAIQALHERIWKVVSQVMENAGKSYSRRFGNCPMSSRHAPNHSLAIGFQHSHSQGCLGVHPRFMLRCPKSGTDSLRFTLMHPTRVVAEM